MLYTTVFYVKSKEIYWQMRTFKWNLWFKHDLETTIGVAWISLPDLSQNFFVKETILFISSTIGKPLTIDMVMRNQTILSYAKVNKEVDLVAKLPKRVRINEEEDVTGEIKSKWIKI